MVSVCLATYNGASFIDVQLRSIINQLNPEDEIIISDDGSTDATLEIINSFADNRIKIFVNDKRSGPVGNFENAISKSTGSVIFLCDQDDIWFKDKIEQHLSFHKEYDLVVSNATVIDEKNNILFKSFFKQRGSKKGLLVNLMRNSYIGCCMSFNRKIASDALPFPSDIHMHDWWIGLVAEIKGKIYFLEEPLMYYIRHSNNASGTLIQTLPFLTQLQNRLIMIKSVLSLITKRSRKT